MMMMRKISTESNLVPLTLILIDSESAACVLFLALSPLGHNQPPYHNRACYHTTISFTLPYYSTLVLHQAFTPTLLFLYPQLPKYVPSGCFFIFSALLCVIIVTSRWWRCRDDNTVRYLPHDALRMAVPRQQRCYKTLCDFYYYY
jgi:hypothetical protein